MHTKRISSKTAKAHASFWEDVGRCFRFEFCNQLCADVNTSRALAITARARTARVLAAAARLISAILILVFVHIIGLVSLIPLLRLLACAALLRGILVAASTAAGTLSWL
jgi:hypothetical protein